MLLANEPVSRKKRSRGGRYSKAFAALLPTGPGMLITTTTKTVVKLCGSWMSSSLGGRDSRALDRPGSLLDYILRNSKTVSKAPSKVSEKQTIA
jgi:hypothetical protein